MPVAVTFDSEDVRSPTKPKYLVECENPRQDGGQMRSGGAQRAQLERTRSNFGPTFFSLSPRYDCARFFFKLN